MTYPLHTKSFTAPVSGIQTMITKHNFTDKILVTITQEGRLAQWIAVPLTPSTPAHGETYLPSSGAQGDGDYDNDVLPLPHLTPRTVLGASTPDRENIGQLFAVQIASQIITRDPGENRSLLLGLGLVNAESLGGDREGWFDLMELVGRCL